MGLMNLIPMLVQYGLESGTRREQKETSDLQQETMKLQQKQMNLNIKEKQQVIDYIGTLSPKEQALVRSNPKVGGLLMFLTNRGQEQPTGQPPGANLAEGGFLPQEIAAQPTPSQTQAGLPGQIAGKQTGLEGLGGMESILKDLLLKEGIGKSKEVRSWQTLQHPETGEWVRVPTTMFGQPVWEQAEPAPPEFGSQVVGAPSGAQTMVLFDKLRGLAGGKPGVQTMQIAPPTMQKPIKEISLPLWVHPETLESPPVGMSPDEAAQQGYRRVSTEAKNRIDAAKGMKEVLIKMTKLMEQVFPPGGGLGERITGAPSRMLAAKTQYDPNAARLQSFINGTVAPIIRSFGEKGNLSETDVKRAINLMPRITDSADVAWGKIRDLVELINNIQRSAIGGKPGLGLKPGKKLEDPLGLR